MRYDTSDFNDGEIIDFRLTLSGNSNQIAPIERDIEFYVHNDCRIFDIETGASFLEIDLVKPRASEAIIFDFNTTECNGWTLKNRDVNFFYVTSDKDIDLVTYSSDLDVQNNKMRITRKT